MNTTLRHLIFWCVCKGSYKVLSRLQKAMRWFLVLPVLRIAYPVAPTEQRDIAQSLVGFTIFCACCYIAYVIFKYLFDNKEFDVLKVSMNSLLAVLASIVFQETSKHGLMYQLHFMAVIALSILLMKGCIFFIQKIYTRWSKRFYLLSVLEKQPDLLTSDLDLLGDRVIPEQYRTDIYIESVRVEATHSIHRRKSFHSTATISFWLSKYYVPIAEVTIDYPWMYEQSPKQRVNIRKRMNVRPKETPKVKPEVSENEQPKNETTVPVHEVKTANGLTIHEKPVLYLGEPKVSKEEHSSVDVSKNEQKSQSLDTSKEEPKAIEIAPIPYEGQPLLYAKEKLGPTSYEGQPLLYGKEKLGPTSYEGQSLLYAKETQSKEEPKTHSKQKKKKKRKKRKKK